jgi:hypothetical protein
MDEPTPAAWRRALEAEGLGEEEYLRERAADEAFPWEVVVPGVQRTFLWREWEQAREGRSGLPCQPEERCTRCGVCGR